MTSPCIKPYTTHSYFGAVCMNCGRPHRDILKEQQAARREREKAKARKGKAA